jgi:hypothetical protein
MSRPPPSSCGRSTAQIPLLKARERESARCERATTHSNKLRNVATGKANTRRRRGHGALPPLLPQTLTLNIKTTEPKKFLTLNCSSHKKNQLNWFWRFHA